VVTEVGSHSLLSYLTPDAIPYFPRESELKVLTPGGMVLGKVPCMP